MIDPFYPRGEGAEHPPVGVGRMLRIHSLQHRFNLSDSTVQEVLYDSRAMRCVGIELGRESATNETMVLKFRYLQETHNLGVELFALINAYLE